MNKILVLFLVVVSFSVHSKSLYNDKTYQPLVSATKASLVGDILTVIIYESSTASAATGADASTSSDVGINLSDGSTDLKGSLGVSSDFDGGGAINRTGKIAAQVSAVVVEINESGLMRIEGQQEIILNNETQQIKVSGYVRPSDIAENNTVFSPRISHSKIEFIGEGILTNSEKPGWITRFFQWIF
ncbi:MAG: flagellar basal body L-ring protein FlgH [Cycloclasticus sp.]